MHIADRPRAGSRHSRPSRRCFGHDRIVFRKWWRANGRPTPSTACQRSWFMAPPYLSASWAAGTSTHLHHLRAFRSSSGILQRLVDQGRCASGHPAGRSSWSPLFAALGLEWAGTVFPSMRSVNVVARSKEDSLEAPACGFTREAWTISGAGSFVMGASRSRGKPPANSLKSACARSWPP